MSRLLRKIFTWRKGGYHSFSDWLNNWKPIHLCWFFDMMGWPIPKYFIGSSIPPTVTTTDPATNILFTTATCSGNITNVGSANPTLRGVCYIAGAGTPTTSNAKVEESGTFGVGAFSENLSSLTANQLYSFRAYATNSKGTGYGSTVTFTTLNYPTVALNTPSNTATGVSRTPTLNFTGTNPAGRTVEYEVEVSKGWSYKKTITITGQTGAGTGYQVLLKIGETSGATGEDFDLEGNSADFPTAKGDGGDLKFTASDGTTNLPFWIETVTGAAPNRLAYVWVKVAADLGSNQDIICWYGNGSASNLSSGADTFVLFDDFDDSTIGAGWTTAVGNSASISESGDTLNQQDAAVSGSYTTCNTSGSQYGPGMCDRRRVRRRDTGTYGNAYLGFSGGPQFIPQNYANVVGATFSDATITNPSAVQLTLNSWYIFEEQWVTSTTANFKIRVDGTYATFGTDRSATATTPVTSGDITNNSRDGIDDETDWIAIRKIVATEPAFSSASAQASGALLDKKSVNNDATFTAGHPFASGVAKEYTVQSADQLDANTTYYWKVRAMDATEGTTYGAWSTPYSFTTESGSAIKTINGLAKASVKTVNGLAIASVKTFNGLA